jgi:chemotaxis protein methyltransferase CheR
MELPSAVYKTARLISKRVPYSDRVRNIALWQSCRYKFALLTDQRTNSGFTGFLRLPTQFVALAGPVVQFLTEGRQTRPLRVVVMGCSNGAEAYTAASILLSHCPSINFIVDAYDVDTTALEKARSSCYDVKDVLNNKVITPQFIEETFDISAGVYRIKGRVAAHVKFFIADALSADLPATVGKCDILLAQNFLFHLDRKAAVRAFKNLCKLLNSPSAVFLDGMDIDLRQKWTRIDKLLPLNFRVEEIHKEARRARAVGWPYKYWGLEPFRAFRGDWRRRYSTIYLKS